MPLSLLHPIPNTWHPITHPSMQPLTAVRLGSLVSGILSSKSRSSQMSDSRQTPTSSVQSKSDWRSVLFPSCYPVISEGKWSLLVKCLKSCVPDEQNNFLGLDKWVFDTVYGVRIFVHLMHWLSFLQWNKTCFWPLNICLFHPIYSSVFQL